MTGEVTLNGRVLPIGGLKQKLLAAQRAGLTEVFVPLRNEPDLDDVPGRGPRGADRPRGRRRPRRGPWRARTGHAAVATMAADSQRPDADPSTCGTRVRILRRRPKVVQLIQRD